MSVSNGEKFLEEAINSVLKEPEEFEFLIINDGSKDDSKEILAKLAKQDSRIRVINQKNVGLTTALNRGIKEAKGEYIARMDDDDYSMPQRFRRQIAVLDANPNVVLVSGGARFMTYEGKIIDHIFPYLRSQDLSRRLYLGNAITHGSVMYRKSAAVKAGLYRQEVGPTEDYDLWTRLMDVGDIITIPFLLYAHRLNPGGISASNSPKQRTEMVNNIDNLWARQQPAVLSRATLKRNLEFYRHQPFGRDQWVWHYLRDNAQLGVKMIKYGHRLKGIWQLIQVALVGRSGLRAVHDRIRAVKLGNLQS